MWNMRIFNRTDRIIVLQISFTHRTLLYNFVQKHNNRIKFFRNAILGRNCNTYYKKAAQK